ncbi:MAG: hypothetical protein Unbinned8622contig1005_32 [Prokaryotic dsDNA virus sp.]|nr:MAG: hypothetical protein Unbinned8622contig1005_32 [Prokaryotic dsDNA virus sp.]|tara:strand:+ start:20841 stop:21209 length:369 start_codon:yes stop_codon:yes gene_type:complete
MEELDAELERCRPWIEAALDRGGNTHLFEDVVSAVKAGTMQFWPADDACAVTEIVVYPRKKVLHIFLAGGNIETIVSMDESAVYFAKLNDCNAVTVAGRKGWQKVLEGRGYTPVLTSLGKDI